MLALRQSLLSVLQRPDAVPAALADAAHAARKALQLHHAMGAVYQLQQRVQTLDSQHKCACCSCPDACGLVRLL
jgi:heterodisulfide reductase subunit A-like polyferredoxin